MSNGIFSGKTRTNNFTVPSFSEYRKLVIRVDLTRYLILAGRELKATGEQQPLTSDWLVNSTSVRSSRREPGYSTRRGTQTRGRRCRATVIRTCCHLTASRRTSPVPRAFYEWMEAIIQVSSWMKALPLRVSSSPPP